MKKNIFTSMFLSMIFINSITFAQEKYNSVYVEAGGNTIFYSINYDRVFRLSAQLKIAPRIGFMYLPMTKIYNRSRFGDIRIPAEVNLLWSKTPFSKNFIEGGIGLNFFQRRERTTSLESDNEDYRRPFGKVSTLRLGYRRQKPTGGLMYRTGLLIPLHQDATFRAGDDVFYRIWAGFSIGYTF